MCKIFDEIREEGIEQGKTNTAIAMLKDGQMSVELISKYSGLTLKEVNDLAKTINV